MYKHPQIGTVHIKVEEVRNVEDVNFCTVKYEDEEKQTTHLKPKTAAEQKWNESFSFSVHTFQSAVEVRLQRHRILRSAKIVGHTKIALPNLQDGAVHHEWYPVTEYLSPKKLQKNFKKEVATIGEIRLEVHYTPLQNKVEKHYKGIVLESEWNKENSGGMIVGNGKWMLNPQFLLTVNNRNASDDAEDSSITEVNIKVFQPETSDEKITCYIMKYEPYWNGRPKVLYESEDIIKIENFNAALFDKQVDLKLGFGNGQYVIIPCTEAPGYYGKFFVNVYSDALEQQQQQKPTSSSEGSDKDDNNNNSKNDAPLQLQALPLGGRAWHEAVIECEWTAQTAGGGDITGTEWRKNPQYLLNILDNDTDTTIVLCQEEKELAIGFYLVRYIDNYAQTKVIQYTPEIEVAKTPSFKHLTSVGLSNIKLQKGQYVIIPCTNTPQTGVMTVRVYADKSFQVDRITKHWQHHALVKSGWRSADGTSGGSPNEPTFTSNPQFILQFPVPLASNNNSSSGNSGASGVQFVVELDVADEQHSIGFLVVQRPNNKVKRIRDKGKINQENIFVKPQGWAAQSSVSCFATAAESVCESQVFVVLPSTFQAGIDKDFTLHVFSDHKFQLTALPSGEGEQPENASVPATQYVAEQDDVPTARESITLHNIATDKIGRKATKNNNSSTTTEN